MDEFTKREDRVAKAGLDAIMREYAFELAKEPAYNKNVKGKNLSGLPNNSLYLDSVERWSFDCLGPLLSSLLYIGSL